MNEELSPQWQRINKIIDKSGLTIHRFAQHIGLRRSERLYQIKAGRNGISRKLAEIIHDAYPEYSVSWILCGTDYGADSSDVVNIPMYGTVHGLMSGKYAHRLIISKSVIGNSRCALRHRSSDPQMPKYMRNITLLLDRTVPQLLRHNDMCFIVTQQYIGACIIDRFDNRQAVHYRCIMNGQEEIRITQFSDIAGVWYIHGMIAQSYTGKFKKTEDN